MLLPSARPFPVFVLPAYALLGLAMLLGLPAQGQPVMPLLEAAKPWMGKDTNAAIVKIEEALSKAEANSPLQDSAYRMMQRYYGQASNQLHPYTEKAEAYERLANYYSERGHNAQLAQLYLQWADLEQEINLGQAVAWVTKADELFKAASDTLGRADCQFRMGVLQGSMGNIDLVMQHFEEALALSKAVEDTAYATEAHTRMAEFYMKTGQHELAAEQVSLALAGAGQAKRSTLINTYRIKGYLASFQEDYATAFQEVERAMQIAEADKDEVRLAMLQLDMAQIHFSGTGDLDAAIDWLEKGAATAAQSGSKRFQKSAQQGLYLAYEALGDAEAALTHFQAFYELEKAIQNESDRQRLLQLEARYSNEKQAAELARQDAQLARQESRQRLLQALLLFLGLLSLIAGGAYYYQLKARRRLSTQHQVIEQQAQALRELDTAKSKLFANISHELRTPLTLILGPASSLAKRLKADAAERPFLEMIQQNGQQLLRRVNEMLDLSKLDAGKLELNEAPLPIKSFLQRQLGLFESYARQQDVALSGQEHFTETDALLADADKLGKIIANLLSNALKFTPPGGKVTLAGERQGDWLSITVSDTGRGIDRAEQQAVFERFYQSQQPEAPLQGGTGIGLAFCKELADLMDGRLEVQSELGQGSRFTLYIPYRAAELPAETAAETGIEATPASVAFASPTALSNGQPKSRLLIVEDNPALRGYLTALLRPEYQVHCAGHGKEALEWLETNGAAAVDLILSDVMMPEMDGFTLLEKLKQDHRYLHLPIIMLTALARQESRLKALRIGVDDYLLKPFQEEELLARIQGLLRNHRARAEAQQEVLEAEHAAPADEATAPSINQEDLEWLARLEERTLALLPNTNFTVDTLADELHTSRRQFYRRVSQLTGLTPNQYLQEARFQAARQMLEQKRYANVKTVAYEVGFKDTRYFSKQYKQRFGRLPSEYL